MKFNETLTLLARLGFAARGVVYIVIGWLALGVARYGGQASDNQGALGFIATAPFGRAMIGTCALGFAGYAAWRLIEAALDPENKNHDLKGRFQRAGYAVSGCAHVVLAWGAARIALRQSSAQHGSPGDESAQSWSAWLLEQPGGVALLLLVAAGIFATAAAQGLKAYKARFDELDGDVPAPQYVRWIGRAGYGARALVFAVLGWLLATAALKHDGDQAGGVGEVLERLRGQSEGTALLAAVAVGLTLFGVFSLVEARYRRIRVPTKLVAVRLA